MPAFTSPEIEEKFVRDGFVVVRLMAEDDARRIAEQCRAKLPAELPRHENVTYIYTDEPDLAWIEEIAGPVFDQGMMPLLPDMQRLHPSVIAKPAGERPVPPHVHPIFTLEQGGSTVFCWCALEDMTEANGVMQVLPGSHKLFPTMPMFGREPYFLKAWDIVESRMEPVYLKAGEAMLFDESLIHSSTANTTSRDRIALATHCIDRSRQAIALFPSDNGQYRVYATGTEFGYQYHIQPDLIEPPAHWPLLGYVDDVHRQVEPEEFCERLASGEHIDLTFDLVPKRDVPRQSLSETTVMDRGGHAMQSLSARLRAMIKRVLRHA